MLTAPTAGRGCVWTKQLTTNTGFYTGSTITAGNVIPRVTGIALVTTQILTCIDCTRRLLKKSL